MLAVSNKKRKSNILSTMLFMSMTLFSSVSYTLDFGEYMPNSNEYFVGKDPDSIRNASTVTYMSGFTVTESERIVDVFLKSGKAAGPDHAYVLLTSVTDDDYFEYSKISNCILRRDGRAIIFENKRLSDHLPQDNFASCVHIEIKDNEATDEAIRAISYVYKNRDKTWKILVDNAYDAIGDFLPSREEVFKQLHVMINNLRK